jgi:excisionase family DNA binding protein
MEHELRDISWIAKKLSVPVSWLYARTRTNEIPHYKIGKYVRFDESEIREWLKGQKTGGDK